MTDTHDETARQMIKQHMDECSAFRRSIERKIDEMKEEVTEKIESVRIVQVSSLIAAIGALCSIIGALLVHLFKW